jgi:hypothetical protein
MKTPHQPPQAPFLQVSHRRLLMLYSVLLIWLIVIVLQQWSQGHQAESMILSVLALNTIRSIVTETGGTHLDDEGIRFITPWSTSYIAWKDVQHIIVRPFEGAIVFEGAAYRLVIPGPLFWSGSDRKWMRAMIDNRAGTNAIPMRTNSWAGWYWKHPPKV